MSEDKATVKKMTDALRRLRKVKEAAEAEAKTVE